MTKLPLHERLREWAKEANERWIFPSIPACREMTDSDGTDNGQEIKLYNAMADEIERDYILKAVDANGKPWEINDPCISYGNDAIVVGYGKPGALFVCYENTGKYSEVSADYVNRPEERTSIEKVRDEIKDCAEFREHITYSLLDGWVKDLTAYIDQQGKDK